MSAVARNLAEGWAGRVEAEAEILAAAEAAPALFQLGTFPAAARREAHALREFTRWAQMGWREERP